MQTEYAVHADYQQGMEFHATCGDHSLCMDYPVEDGQPTAGLTPLETLLTSLAGCVGGAMTVLLRRSQQQFSGMSVDVGAKRREEHPTVFTAITLDVTVRGNGLDEETVRRCFSLAEERLCPVWAMLKGGVPITAAIHVVAADPAI